MKLSNNKAISFVLNMILDLLFLIVLIFSIVCAIITLSTHANILGVRLGIIQSKSMEVSEMYVGDIVSIKKEDSYQIGDIIAFYRDISNYDKDIKDLDMSKKPIWIHEIIDIKIDEAGNYSYLTKGTSNQNDDSFYVPYDFVLGVGKVLSPTLNSIIGFVVSRIGIICLIIIPCIIMLIYLTWELIMILTEEPEEKTKYVRPAHPKSTYELALEYYKKYQKPLTIYMNVNTKNVKPITYNQNAKNINIGMYIVKKRKDSDNNA